MEGIAYIAGEDPVQSGPLARFLPPIPSGIAAKFIQDHAHLLPQQGNRWILDPFGASPAFDAEMARLGYTVLVTVNNPITRFLFEMAAKPASQAELRAALADLAASRKGEERLETHLQELYMTDCSRCQQKVPVEAFIWDKQSGELVGRVYQCECGEAGEFPATAADKARAARLAATDSLHRSRALERVIDRNDPDRHNAEEALACYLPRAVYALITIVNKLDSLSLPPERRQALLALLLTTFDETSSLWPYPVERPRPKQLSIPSRYQEKNVWTALEKSVAVWANDGVGVRLTKWPELPGEGGGLCLFEGPVRDLVHSLIEAPIQAVITTFPRPNQAFWTLSALWTGWLWGYETAVKFKSVLHRRRYDWSWHAGALSAALKYIPEHLPLNAPFFGLVTEAEPSFLSATILAAAEAGFELEGLALRTRFDPIEILWRRQAFTREHGSVEPIDPENVERALQDFLKKRGEPAPYLHLHSAGLACMSADHSLHLNDDALNEILLPIQTALLKESFIHYSESVNLESGLWGLAEWNPDQNPLPDQVEVFVVRFLQEEGSSSLEEIGKAVNAQFCGLQTPSLGLLKAILASYGVEAEGKWSLRTEEAPVNRRADLEKAGEAVGILGTRLGYAVVRDEGGRTLEWQDGRQTQTVFHLTASAVITNLLRRQKSLAGASQVLVLPGGRAGLLAYKLVRDPALAALARGWKMVKFRHLRRLAETSDLSREQFEKNISSDPIEPPEQMKLF